MEQTCARLTVMSFNVLVSEEKQADIYDRVLLREHRLGPAAATISRQHPDIIGLQEISEAHREYLSRHPLLSDYDMKGSPMKPELHEQGVYVMYDRTRYDLRDWGIRWLSENPDEEHSYLREAVMENENRLETEKGIMHQPRKVVYVVLENRVTRRKFAFCDTHLGHTPPGSDPAVSDLIRLRQAKILVDMIASGDLFEPSLPFIIVGDMNSRPHTPPHEAYCKIAQDAAEAAQGRSSIRQGTLHSYRLSPEIKPIDYIFFDKREFRCQNFDVITKPCYSEPLGMEILPSDHYALTAAALL